MLKPLIINLWAVNHVPWAYDMSLSREPMTHELEATAGGMKL